MRVTSGHGRIIIAVIKTDDKIIIWLGGSLLSVPLCVSVPVEASKCVSVCSYCSNVIVATSSNNRKHLSEVFFTTNSCNTGEKTVRLLAAEEWTNQTPDLPHGSDFHHSHQLFCARLPLFELLLLFIAAPDAAAETQLSIFNLAAVVFCFFYLCFAREV